MTFYIKLIQQQGERLQIRIISFASKPATSIQIYVYLGECV